jgi:hypothetical protein
LAQEERMAEPIDIAKSINLIHESGYKSRLAKLVTQVPKRQSVDVNRLVKENPNKIKFKNVFEFLASDKWNLITLNDLYDIINRQESDKQNKEWFKKRIRPFMEDVVDHSFKTMF